MPKFEIKHKKTGEVLFSGRGGTFKEYVQALALSGTDASLSGFVLSRLRLKKAAKVRIYGADFKESDLSGIDLTEADMTGSDLSGANLEGSLMPKANFSRTTCKKANLSRY